MLDASISSHRNKIKKYGKAKGYLLGLELGLPVYKHYFVITNVKDIDLLLNWYPAQNYFCMRSDTIVGSMPLGIRGRNGNRGNIYNYFEEIKKKSKTLGTSGVMIVYFNDGEFCPTYKVQGCFYISVKWEKSIDIDYLSNGFDGSFLSSAREISEIYSISFNDILYLKSKNKNKYLQYKISSHEYERQRDDRIEFLIEKYNLDRSVLEEYIPISYPQVKNNIFDEVVDTVIKCIFNNYNFISKYEELIIIIQVENDKLVCPEVILPERLKEK